MVFLMNCMQLIPFIGGLFGSKQTAPPEGRGDPEGKGGPPGNTEPETKVKPRDTVPKDDKKVGGDPPPVDVYAAKITPQTVVEPDITHTVKRGECWYDVLDAKYPGIPSSDRQAAMRALKLANGMTDPKSADMPRQMILPKELTVGENTYKLDNSGEVHGSVVEFTQGGMYDANIGQTETTTYTLTGTKNGESKFSQTYADKAEAEAARAEWLAQNKEKT